MMSCRGAGCWVDMYIFSENNDGVQLLKTLCCDSKAKDTVASGWGWVTHCLSVTWLLRTQWLLNLRGVEA